MPASHNSRAAGSWTLAESTVGVECCTLISMLLFCMNLSRRLPCDVCLVSEAKGVVGLRACLHDEVMHCMGM